MEKENYTWTQELDSLEVKIKVNDKFTREDVQIIIKGRNIEVLIKNNCLLKGELFGQVYKDSLWWNIEDEVLVLTLFKTEEKYWDCVIIGHTKVDINEAMGSREADFNALDPEAKQLVQKMLYEQGEKLNKPTSPEDEELLKKFREGEGIENREDLLDKENEELS